MGGACSEGCGYRMHFRKSKILLALDCNVSPRIGSILLVPQRSSLKESNASLNHLSFLSFFWTSTSNVLFLTYNICFYLYSIVMFKGWRPEYLISCPFLISSLPQITHSFKFLHCLGTLIFQVVNLLPPSKSVSKISTFAGIYSSLPSTG